MPVQRAITTYRTEGLNCAQSVLRAFQPVAERKISDSHIEQARQLGGGRAEGGRCGALHAALQLAGEDERMPLRDAFVVKAGSEQCREIRRSRTLTCEQCVVLAVSLLAEPTEA